VRADDGREGLKVGVRRNPVDGAVRLEATPGVWMTSDEAEELAAELHRLATEPLFNPDAALERQRALISRINGYVSFSALAQAATELADLTQALDDNLSEGAALPRAWLSHPRPLARREDRT
jgi:hypothetical protein